MLTLVLCATGGGAMPQGTPLAAAVGRLPRQVLEGEGIRLLLSVSQTVAQPAFL